MDRLTARYGDNRAVPTRVDLTFAFDIDDEDYLGLADIFDRLADYEETELDPKDIDTLMARSEGLAERLCELTCDQAVTYNRLRELAVADKDGRCVVLPCNVGDTVYIVSQVFDGARSKMMVGSRRIDSIAGNALNPVWMVSKEPYELHFSPSEFGKTVFLTRDEADAALGSESIHEV